MAVVIPCFNHGAFIREAVESARRQTYPNVEIVVVDDGSTDAPTIEMLGSLRAEGIRVLRQENRGLAAARNAGIRATDAEFFVPLDADDIIKPAFVERLIAPLRADPALGYMYCHTEYFGSSGGVWQCPDYDPHKLLVGNLSTATALVRRRAFDQAGGYAEAMTYGMEDWDFWLSLLEVGCRGKLVPELLFGYRQHAGGSMLAHTQRHRPIPVRQIIERHAPMYLVHMEAALTEKDSMFFREHMDAWRARCTIEELQRRLGLKTDNPAAAGPPALSFFPDLTTQPREELERILASRAWRSITWVKRSLLYRALARIRFGPGWEGSTVAESPEARLAKIKVSRSYRTIQRLKGFAVYRWYARRAYGGPR